MIKKVNKVLSTDSITKLDDRFTEELEERVELACWNNQCGCNGGYFYCTVLA